jgi:hypothetical protein
MRQPLHNSFLLLSVMCSAVFFDFLLNLKLDVFFYIERDVTLLKTCLGRHEHERAAMPNGPARHAPESLVSCPCLADDTMTLLGTARQARGSDRAVPNRAMPGPVPCRAARLQNYRWGDLARFAHLPGQKW